MKRRESEGETHGLVERGLRWDVSFNRKLGVAALVVAGGVSIAGAPMVGSKIALFAGANFAVAEIENRLARSLEQRQ